MRCSRNAVYDCNCNRIIPYKMNPVCQLLTPQNQLFIFLLIPVWVTGNTEVNEVGIKNIILPGSIWKDNTESTEGFKLSVKNEKMSVL